MGGVVRSINKGLGSIPVIGGVRQAIGMESIVNKTADVLDEVTGQGGDAFDTSGQQDAAMRAIELQEQVYNEALKRGQPFYDVGKSGIEELSQRLGLSEDAGTGMYGSLMQTYSPEQLTEDPSYQFRLAEGEKALQRQLAAQGKTMSPEALKELQSYGQGMASQEYSNAYDRYRLNQGDIFNRLASVAGIGQQEQSTLTGAGQNYAGNVGQTITSLADAESAAAQAEAAQKQSMFNTLVQGGLTAALMFSDERLKEKIEKVGEKNGFNIYEFNYIGQPTRYRGVMAQEVEKVMPEAVGEINGVKAVNYDMIGIEMEEV